MLFLVIVAGIELGYPLGSIAEKSIMKVNEEKKKRKK